MIFKVLLILFLAFTAPSLSQTLVLERISRHIVLELVNEIAELRLAIEFYSDMEQVRWKGTFYPIEDAKEHLSGLEKVLFFQQAGLHGITTAEHRGEPTRIELNSLAGQISHLIHRIHQLEGTIYAHDQEYERQAGRPGNSLTNKLFYRAESQAITEEKKWIEHTLQVLRKKIELYAPYMKDPVSQRNLESLMQTYNLAVLALALPKHNIYSDATSILGRLFQSQKGRIISPMFPKHLNLFYAEFEINDLQSPRHNAQQRMINFEKALRELQRANYQAPKNFSPQNGFQEAAYYHARIRSLPLTSDLVRITEQQHLVNFIAQISAQGTTCAKYFK